MSYSVAGEMRGTSQLKGIRVLVVDDDDDTRELVGMMLTAAGALVTLAESGDEALTTAAHDTDVVLSDLNMTNMNGVELVAALRRRGSIVPCIALTGFDKDAAVGFDAHMQKPIDGLHLVEVIATLAAAHARATTS
jgi:CheY-like chemotaxis protein